MPSLRPLSMPHTDQCRCEWCAEVFNIIMEYVDGPDLFEYVREHVRCAR